MKCRYCNIALSPLRSLEDGEFCCDGHRQAYQQQLAVLDKVSSAPPPDSLLSLHFTIPSAAREVPQPPSVAAPLTSKLATQGPVAALRRPSAQRNLPFAQRPMPLTFHRKPAAPGSQTNPVAVEPQFAGAPLL